MNHILIVSSLLVVGVAGMVLNGNVVRKIMALNIFSTGILFLYSGSQSGSVAPLITDGILTDPVDHVPQALMLTAIVIGVWLTALAPAMRSRLYEKTGTLDLRLMEKTLKRENQHG